MTKKMSAKQQAKFDAALAKLIDETAAWAAAHELLRFEHLRAKTHEDHAAAVARGTASEERGETFGRKFVNLVVESLS